MKTNFVFLIIIILMLITFIPFNKLNAGGISAKNPGMKEETINFTVTVIDKGESVPLQSVVVLIKEGNSIIAKSSTNAFGRAFFNDLGSGHYKIAAYYIGYNDFNDSVTVDSLHQTFLVKLVEKTTQLKEIVIEGETVNKVATTINIESGLQEFEGETYHAAPGSQMTQLVQENLAGAVRAPTGEVHIRGQHGEFTYLVDGIPIPLGVFGGLNEIVDPKVISSVTFYTGGFPAEFGGQITGLMDIQNRVPTGQFHLDASTFIGSYLTSNSDSIGNKAGTFKAVNSNGQSLSFSDHIGKLGYFISTSRQESDRRIDQPVTQLFHDQGTDYFFYGKFDYLLNDNDFLTANLNFSNTLTQVPYDPLEGFAADDQHSYNAFQTLSFYHTINSSSDRETNLFIGAFAREGGLNLIPNVNDTAGRIFLNNDSTQSYAVDQDRSFSTFGIRTKYDQSLSHHFKYAFGFNYSYTTGTENFRFFNTTGDKQTNINNFNGYDFGVFAQSEWHPFEWTRLEYGIRYDVHSAPAIGVQYQLEPRFKWNFFLDEFNSIAVSYSRLFMPTNIENLGAVAAQLGNNASPTLPEKDNLYEIDLLRNWQNGFATKFAGFLKESSPGLDDQTLGSSTIKVNVNINKIIVRGIELALTYSDPYTPFSGFINGSIIHAFGTGPVSGGFLPSDPSTDPFDLDHDQRLSAVVGLNYQPKNLFVSITGIYGSGLANGNSDYVFKTGLFDFNQGAHTTPSWIFNVSAGYTIPLQNGQSIEPSLYINNIFDHAHLLKGAFFSGASFEERRNVVLKLSYHI
jgi:hypothetical protein